MIDEIIRLSNRYKALGAAMQPLRTLRRKWHQRSERASRLLFSRLEKVLVEDPVVAVAEFQGTFSMAVRSHLFRRVVQAGEYEPILTARCRDLIDPERDAMDIGANIGFHTVFFAKHINQRRVVAVEPTRNALLRLRRNIVQNHVGPKVIIFEGVASNMPGFLDIKTIDGLEEYSTFGALVHPAIVGSRFVTERVEARTLDQLASEHQLDCGFIKVDTEGVEHLVFEGARELLASHRPVVVSELSDVLLRRNGSSALEVVRLFESFDYVVSDPLHPGEQSGFRPFGDIICLPKEHPRARGK